MACKKIKILTLTLIYAICQLKGQVVINEIVASNLSYSEDSYGEDFKI